MTTRICPSRSTVLLAGPALIAVLAILAGTPVWTASAGSPRLAVASLVALTGEVLPSAVGTAAEGTIRPVASRVPDRLGPVHTDRHRIGLLRLVLPPPSA